MKNLVFTVTNDLNYDQRMIRICGSLAEAGYQVLLVGRELPGSPAIITQPFSQKRLRCFFHSGKMFYVEFNLRLLFFLFFAKIDLICAIDLDTIVPCYIVSRLRRIQKVYDAHELFCEMKEIVERPRVYKAWKWIERHTVPAFANGYTVNEPIAQQFHSMYNVNYEVIRNIAVLQPLQIPEKKDRYILYQGAVNEGRCFETLIPAMNQVNARLIVCGDGNFMSRAKQLVAQHRLEDKIIFMGKIKPSELRSFTVSAWIGITLFENRSLNNYYSLANRFFDYLHAGVPQICVNYPVYQDLNNPLPFAVLIDNLEADNIAGAINRLLNDDLLYYSLQKNSLLVREQLNWQNEEKKLLAFYSQLKFTLG